MAKQASDSIDRLAEGNDLSRLVLDALTAEVAVLDKSGAIVAVNEAWRQFAAENGGLPEATGVGANYLEICRRARGEDSAQAEQVREGIERILDGSLDVFQLEYPCHSPTEQRWFLVYASRLQTAEPLVVTTHLSITDRKFTEQRLVVAERLAAIGEAMQGLTHEGRNALQRAQACIELLRIRVESDDEAVDLLQRIESAQDRLLAIYEEVGTYAGPITLCRESCHLDELVDEVLTVFESHFASASFSHIRGRGDLTCDIDVTATRQVLQLVIENALTTGADSPEIEVSYSEGQLDGLSVVTVVVSDNGPGIPPGDREKVFKPFYTTKTRGTGLGLAIAERVVTAHGGRITFGTPLRGGASVYITLPTAAAS